MHSPRAQVSPGEIVREWGRIGCIGFGGPPAHIALLRDLCVERRAWLSPREFEDALAACNLLPGPATTQLAIFCAWRVGGRSGALLGGLGFILPGLLLILGLSVLFLASAAPVWVRGAGAGAGAAVAAVAVHAGIGLVSSELGPGEGPRSLDRLRGARRSGRRRPPRPRLDVAEGRCLSYGGGFVIVPLMQGDAVDRYHWMTDPQFLNAVALGQVTPGPVTHTVAAVGYAAAGMGGALLAAFIAFLPSFSFVLLGALVGVLGAGVPGG